VRALTRTHSRNGSPVADSRSNASIARSVRYDEVSTSPGEPGTGCSVQVVTNVSKPTWKRFSHGENAVCET
jgi:hypothetical protein